MRQKQGSASGGAYVSIILFAMHHEQRRQQRGQERHISGANCIVFFRSYPRIVILSGVARALCGLRSRRTPDAERDANVCGALCVRRTPKKPALPILLEPFPPQAPWQKQHGMKRSKPHGRGRNLRGPSTPDLAKCARSSAQDDDFEGSLEELLRMNASWSRYGSYQRASLTA